jgi:hypothetical protein
MESWIPSKEITQGFQSQIQSAWWGREGGRTATLPCFLYQNIKYMYAVTCAILAVDRFVRVHFVFSSSVCLKRRAISRFSLFGFISVSFDFCTFNFFLYLFPALYFCIFIFVFSFYILANTCILFGSTPFFSSV